MKLLLILISALLAAGSAHATPYLYGMGPGGSPTWPGFTSVTPDNVYSPSAGFGWQNPEGMKSYARAYEAPLENKNRGAQEPPGRRRKLVHAVASGQGPFKILLEIDGQVPVRPGRARVKLVFVMGAGHSGMHH